MAGNVITPKKAIKATAGHQVKAYVVINDFSNKVTAKLKATGAAAFETKFAEEIEMVASEAAKYQASNDIIMMTNDVMPTPSTIAPNVPEATAIAGGTNHIQVSVSRIASRAIVTMKTGLMSTPISVKDANGVEKSKITLKKIQYSVGAGNKKVFTVHKAGYETPAPLYGFVPTDNTDWSAGLKNMDYSGVKTFANLQEINDKADVRTALVAETTDRKFVLPVTHASGNYRKGNTTYFEIRCEFVPNEIDGVAYTGAPKTVFLGTNDGKFYSTRALATANGQKATQYVNGVMKYVLWLNPNKDYNGTEKITESPTVRNQVYHAHIAAFKGIGVPNNPINPGPNPDPNNPNPNDPDNPTPDPENPTNPINPGDPLQVQDTYLSVSIQVLQWGIHSYDVNIDSNIY